MERIFQSTHNGVLTAHTWVAARCATEVFQSHLCSTYRGLWGWWLSTCCSSVVDHWLHKSGLLGSIPRSCQPFCFPLFSPQNILILFIPEKLSHKRSYSKLSMPKYDVSWLKGWSVLCFQGCQDSLVFLAKHGLRTFLESLILKHLLSKHDPNCCMHTYTLITMAIQVYNSCLNPCKPPDWFVG